MSNTGENADMYYSPARVVYEALVKSMEESAEGLAKWSWDTWKYANGLQSSPELSQRERSAVAGYRLAANLVLDATELIREKNPRREATDPEPRNWV